MPVVAEKRGRHSKHQHSIETAVALRSGGAGGAGPTKQPQGGDMTPPQRVKLPLFSVPDAFHMMLESIVHELAEQPLPSLHEAVNHPYSGPALALLVQVGANKAQATITYQTAAAAAAM